MRTFYAHLSSTSPYSQSRPYSDEKKAKETYAAYEKRTWRNKAHADDKGEMFIPPLAFKNCFVDAAKYLSIQIPGKGKNTYTKHFKAGILITQNIMLGINKADVLEDKVFGSSTGKSGGSRVWKSFPIVHEWKGILEITILDDTITKDVLYKHIKQAGIFIGIGRWRAINGGLFGRFSLDKLVEA